MKKINSYKTNIIKNYNKYCKKNNVFIVEGVREFIMAIKGGFCPKIILIYKYIFNRYELINLYKSISYSINKKIFNKLVYRDNSDGIVTFFKKKNIKKNINDIKINNYYLVLILDGIEKPGNLGAIFRVANSIGFNLIILCNIKTYIFNSNVIRCSLGSVFTSNIIFNDALSTIYWLKRNNFKIIVSGFNKNSINLYKYKFDHTVLSIVFGSESKGVSNIWIEKSDKIIKIPMFGDIDSLNVSNAMSIITYEIIRQWFYI